jgi:hypothetical protein
MGNLMPDLPTSSAPHWQVGRRAEISGPTYLLLMGDLSCSIQMLHDAGVGLYEPGSPAALSSTTNCAYSCYASVLLVWFHSL